MYNLKVSKEFFIQFSSGIMNVFNSTQHDHDKGVYRDPGYIYGPSQPRMVYFGMKLGNILH